MFSYADYVGMQDDGQLAFQSLFHVRKTETGENSDRLSLNPIWRDRDKSEMLVPTTGATQAKISPADLPDLLSRTDVLVSRKSAGRIL